MVRQARVCLKAATPCLSVLFVADEVGISTPLPLGQTGDAGGKQMKPDLETQWCEQKMWFMSDWV